MVANVKFTVWRLRLSAYGSFAPELRESQLVAVATKVQKCLNSLTKRRAKDPAFAQRWRFGGTKRSTGELNGKLARLKMRLDLR